MENYTLFYSWQSDVSQARNLIEKALEHVLKKLDLNGTHIELLQDSRGQNGAQNISIGLLDSIGKSDFFIADITPVTDYDGKEGLKLCPNSNAMFEYGYAMSQLGESKCKQFVYLKTGQTMPQMPFDINQRKSILLKEEDLKKAEDAAKKGKAERNTKDIEDMIEGWLLECIKEIKDARQNTVPDQGATLSFENDQKEWDIYPPFIRINYIPEKPKKPIEVQRPIDKIIKGTFANDWVENFTAQADSLDRVYPVSAKIVTKTIFESRMPVRIRLSNTGQTALDNIKIQINLPDDCDAKLYEVNEETKFPMIVSKQSNGAIFINDDNKALHSKFNTLNPQTSEYLNTFYILPPAKDTDIEISWEISSRNYNTGGTLLLRSHPLFEDSKRPSATKSGETEIIQKITDR